MTDDPCNMTTDLGVLAPSERAPMEVVRRQSRHFQETAGLRAMLDAVPGILLVLNEYRQIVFGNGALARLLGVPRPDAVYGRRPGEVLDCEHACECPGGCGTSETCTTCGAARAIWCAERGSNAINECRILQKQSGRALDLRISTSPFEIGGERFSIVALTDISHEKRRMALERIFFHDLLNTAGGVMGYLQLLQRTKGGELEELSRSAMRLTRTLVEEIKAQRELTAAENEDLKVHWERVEARAIVENVVDLYRNDEAGRGREVVIDPAAAVVSLESDRQLLSRVLGNMVRNALEASPVGQTVSVGCEAAADAVEFWVHNAGHMPRAVQLQVFQRSFSTKGVGRGLGTYSMKLLTERYLKGRVWFTTSPEDGTRFHVRVPRERGE